MTADFGLVTHAAEGHSNELSSKRLRNGPGERRLADARRADKAENRALHGRVQLSNREVLEDAVLGLLEPRVVGVEHPLGLRQVDDFIGSFRPRQGDQPIDVGPRDRVLGGRGWHFRQPVEFAQRFLLHALGHAGSFDLFRQFLDFLRLVVALTEFLLDRLHLLSQEVLALVLAHLGLHL